MVRPTWEGKIWCRVPTVEVLREGLTRRRERVETVKGVSDTRTKES